MRKAVLLFLAIALFGCATTKYPPPSVRDGYYLNPEYEFSVKIPAGWLVGDQIPDVIKETFAPEKDIAAMFFNEQAAGMILISVDKTEFDEPIRVSTGLYNITNEYLLSILNEKRERLESDPSVLEYSYDLGHDCDFTETLLTKQPNYSELIKLTNTAACYHHNNHFYLAFIIFVSNSQTFDQNYEIYTRFIEHFQTGKFMYGQDEAGK
jgi:hypothetical protein